MRSRLSRLPGRRRRRERQIDFQSASASLLFLRRHRIGDQGGAVGPDLSEIGAKKDRPYLLESIVDPNRTIAENFETVVILDDLGKTISGHTSGRKRRLFAAHHG